MVDLPPLYTRIEYTQDTEYDDREGVDVDSFGIHHAVTTSLQGIIDLSKAGGRTVSMTLAVKDDDRVLIVPLWAQPFTSASSYDNRSWTVEAANMTMAPDYLLSDATYRSLAIIAAHAHRNEGVPLRVGVPGLYQHKNLYEWFGASYPTACAGPWFDTYRVVREAEQLLALTNLNPEEGIMVPIRVDGRIFYIAPEYLMYETNPAGAELVKNITTSDDRYVDIPGGSWTAVLAAFGVPANVPGILVSGPARVWSRAREADDKAKKILEMLTAAPPA